MEHREQSLYASIISCSNDAIISKDLDGNITSWNSGGEQQFGYTSDEIIGKPVLLLIPPDLQHEEADIIRKIKRGEVISLETKRVKKNGGIIHVSLVISPLRNPTGKIIGACKISRDITEKIIAENSLLKAENRLNLFIRAINQSIIYRKDQDSLLKEVSNIAKNVGGYEMVNIWMLGAAGSLFRFDHDKEYSGENEFKKFSGMDFREYPLNTSPAGKVLASGRYIMINDIANDPEWGDLCLRTNIRSAACFPITKMGKLVGMVTFLSREKNFFNENEITLLEESATDISFALEVFEKEKWRKEAEIRLEQSEHRFKKAQSIAHIGHWEMDLDTGVSIWSEESCRIYGLDPNDNRQTFDTWKSFIHPDDMVSLTDKINEMQTVFTDHSFNHRIVRKDGTVRHVHSQSQFMFDSENKPTGLYGIAHDVTDQKIIEETLKKSEANLMAVIESSDALIYSLDTDFRYITFNNALRNKLLTVYGLEIKAGDKVYDFLKNLEPAEAKEWELVYSVALMGKSLKFTKEYNINNVRSFTSFSINPIKENERVIGLSCYARDITQEKKSEEKLLKSELQIRNFASHINELQEEERAHLAREIHDELGQQLVGIKIGLSSVSKFSKGNTLIEESVKEMLKDIDTTIQSLRKIATELRPGILDSLGLVPSIIWLVKEYERKKGIICKLNITAPEYKYGKNISTCFFRICQEALTNIAKHADATEIQVEMKYSNGLLTMTITDNGNGISKEKLENPFSMGLLGMRERANAISGDLNIQSKKGHGTSIHLSVKVNVI